MRRHRPFLPTFLALLSLGSALFGCGDDSVDYGVDVATDPSFPDALAQLRARQLLRFTVDGVEYAEPSHLACSGDASEACVFLPPNTLQPFLNEACSTTCSGSFGGTSTTTCSSSTCAIEALTCTANLLLELASLVEPKTMTTGTAPNEQTLYFPVQSKATQALLREAAFTSIHAAGVLGAAVLGDTWMSGIIGLSGSFFEQAEEDCTSPRDPADPSSPTWLEAFAISVIELGVLGEEAAHAAARDYVAIADGEFGQHAIIQQGSHAARDLRMHAAHLLVGGGYNRYGTVRGAVLYGPLLVDHDAGTPDGGTTFVELDTLPLATDVLDCLGADLTSTQRRAYEILQETAPPPNMVTNASGTVTLSQLLTTVQTRYANLRGVVDPVASLTEDQFLAYLNVGRPDFTTARARMADEIRVYGRSARTFPDRTVPNLSAPNNSMYAATANSNSALPSWMYFASIVAEPGVSHQSVLTQPGGAARPVVQFTGLPSAVDVAYLASLLGESLLAASASTALSTSAQQAYHDAGVQIRDHFARSGSLFYAGKGEDASRRLYVAAAITDNPARYALVTSLDELECATTGQRDGISCDPDDFIAYAGDELTESQVATAFGSYNVPKAAASAASFATGRRVVGWDDFTTVGPGFEQFFVIRTNDSAGTDRGPGKWQPIGVGWTYSGDYYYFTNIDPGALQEAGTIAMPNADWCAMPAVSCADDIFDTRIPLEDELTDDGNAYENSWRRYLDLATQAAAEADALGREAQGASLEIDQISEGALADLEELCGAILSIDPLQACGPNHTGPCPTDLQGILATYEANTDPNIDRLSRCLGLAGQLTYATTGTQPLCVWYKGDPTQLCVTAPGDEVKVNGNDYAFVDTDGNGMRSHDEDLLECPRLQGPADLGLAGCRVPGDPMGNTYEAFLIGGPVDIDGNATGDGYRSLLGFFDPPPDQGQEDNTLSCNSIRALREAILDGAGEDAIFELFAEVFYTPSNTLDTRWFPQNLREIAGAIEYVGKPGTFTDILVNGSPMITTGDPFTGRSVTGFCSATPWDTFGCDEMSDGQTDYSHSLLCPAVSPVYGTQCTASDWSKDRLAIAAMTARVLGGLGYDGFVVPSVFDESGDCDDYSLAWIYGIGIGEGAGSYSSAWLGCGQADGSGSHYVWMFPYAYQASFRRVGELESDEQGVHFFNNDAVVVRAWNYYYQEAEIVEVSDAELASYNALGYSNLLRDWAGASRARSGIVHDLVTTGLHTPVGSYLKQWDLSTTKLISESFPRFPFSRSEASGGTRTNLVPDPARLPEEVLYFDQLLDAAELICEARTQNGSQRFGCGAPASGNVQSLIYHAADQLECIADDINDLGAKLVLHGLPTSALDALREQTTVGAVPVDGGQYAQSISRIRQRLIALTLAPSEIQSQLDGLSRDVRRVAQELQRSDVQDQIDQVQLQSTIADRITSCVTAANSIGGGAPWGIPGQTVAAAATCANSALQIGNAIQIARLQGQLNDASRDLLLLNLEDSIAQRAEALEALGKQILFEIEGLDGELSQLEIIQRRAERAAYRALFLDDPNVQQAFSTSQSLRQRYETSRVRYDRARRDAIRMAFLAKRAVEQRFGVRLASLGQEMTLVEAPSSWEASLCSMEGMDPATGRTSDGGAVTSYADGYIGDYVHKLERFVDSYRIDYPFSDGSDLAVVSLRDDVVGSRAFCPAEVGNWLLFSNSLDRFEPSTSAGWKPYGCDDDAFGDPEPNCAVAAIAYEPPLPAPPGSTYGDPIVYSIHFGPPHPECDGQGTCPCATADCGWNSSVVYGQEVYLPRGTYRMSWYGVHGEGAARHMVVRDRSSWTDLATVPIGSGPASWNGTEPFPPGFTRYWRQFTVADNGFYVIGIRTPPWGGQIVPNVKVDVAGLMLEYLDPAALPIPLDTEPPPFAETGPEPTHLLPVCEDTDGTNFRNDAWQYDCVSLCPTGFGGDCTRDASNRYCYWETFFQVTPGAIDRGEIFGASGFARGNFNYRTESIGVNFVGTGARTCADATLPSTCYNAGWIPYSLEHIGPYDVTNNFGDIYDAPLFNGRIEHARGLAVERYLTNPISSADQSMMAQYEQRQFRGRPLTGRYRLRVWDEPGVNFNGIEDVQLLLRYRYWTRQN